MNLPRTQNILSMKRIILFCLIIISLLSCDGQKNTQNGDVSSSDTLRPAKGERFYGGVFNLNEPEYIKTLFPHSIIDAYSYRVACQIYEGLFKFDQDSLKVIPSLVESYETNADKTVYTFKIKKGVYFHDNDCFTDSKGRELKAADIKYCFSKLCTYYQGNQGTHVFDGVLKGATQYLENSKKGTPSTELESIRIIDDYTVEMTLEKPNSLFLNKLCRAESLIFPKEAYQKYGLDMRMNPVGTGAFKLGKISEGISLILLKNQNYHGIDKHGNKLPFLEAIKISFVGDKQLEMLEFKQGKLDMVYRLPADQIFDLLQETTTDPAGSQAKYVLQREPEMQTQLISLLNIHPVLKDVKVRKAISYAIDREKILNYILGKEGFKAGINGITPPSFPEYDIDKIVGYGLNIDSARYFLKAAGFAGGKGFPTLTIDLNPESDRNTSVAREVKKQLSEHLNINLELNIAPHAQVTEKMLSGKYETVRLSWIADYPNPQAFLWMFHSKNMPDSIGSDSYPNLPRYRNAKFDEYYDKALQATNSAEATNYFMKAEQVAMSDAPVIILWYDEGYRLLYPKVKNFPSNPMQYRDFSEVYFDTRQAEEGF